MKPFSMDNEDFDKSGYFDLLIQKSTYANLIYSLLSIPISIIYLVLSVSGIIVGFLFIPLWIGVPILIGYFNLIWRLSKLEEKIYCNYLFISLPALSKFQPLEHTSILLLKTFLKNKRSWMRIVYFLTKFATATVLFIPTLLLIGLGFSMIYIPINSVFGHIDFYGLYQTDSFIEVTFIYFLAGVIWVGILHGVNYTVALSAKIATRFLCR